MATLRLKVLLRWSRNYNNEEQLLETNPVLDISKLYFLFKIPFPPSHQKILLKNLEKR